ncbi:MAG: hypothetical protein WD941_04970 [Opitutus sp.]
MQLERSLSYARGYLGLGMVNEAAVELDRIALGDRNRPEVVALRMAVLQAQKDWPALLEVARDFVSLKPGSAAGWITWAYAARRASSLAEAENILLAAERHHPDEPTIQFNLGCYACQRGQLAEARRRVDRAIALEPKFGEAAATDPDLAPLRDACKP